MTVGNTTLDASLRRAQTALDVAALADAMAEAFTGIHDTALRLGFGTEPRRKAFKDLAARLTASAERTRGLASEHWDAAVRTYTGTELPGDLHGGKRRHSIRSLAVDDVGRLLGCLWGRQFAFAPPSADAEAAARAHALTRSGRYPGDEHERAASVLDALDRAARGNAAALFSQWVLDQAVGTDTSYLALAAAALRIDGTARDMELLQAQVHKWSRLTSGAEAAPVPRNWRRTLDDPRIARALRDAQAAFGIAAVLRTAAAEAKTLGAAVPAGEAAYAARLVAVADRVAAVAVHEWQIAIRRVGSDHARSAGQTGRTWAADVSGLEDARDRLLEIDARDFPSGAGHELRARCRDANIDLGRLALGVETAAESHLTAFLEQRDDEADRGHVLEAALTAHGKAIAAGLPRTVQRRGPEETLPPCLAAVDTLVTGTSLSGNMRKTPHAAPARRPRNRPASRRPEPDERMWLRAIVDAQAAFDMAEYIQRAHDRLLFLLDDAAELGVAPEADLGPLLTLWHDSMTGIRAGSEAEWRMAARRLVANGLGPSRSATARLRPDPALSAVSLARGDPAGDHRSRVDNLRADFKDYGVVFPAPTIKVLDTAKAHLNALCSGHGEPAWAAEVVSAVREQAETNASAMHETVAEWLPRTDLHPYLAAMNAVPRRVLRTDQATRTAVVKLGCRIGRKRRRREEAEARRSAARESPELGRAW